MRSTPRSLLVAVAALALLTGCAEAAPAQTAAPTATPTTTPTATPTPTPTPTATATAAPAGPQIDFADGTACGDATAIDPESVATVSWMGDYEEQLASAELQVGFEPTGVFSTDEVLCSLSYKLPLDGSPSAVGHFSVAYVRDASVPDQVEAWAAANGYGPSSESQPMATGGVWVTADGMGRLSVHPLDQLELERERRTTGVDLQPTDVQVLHRTTVPAD